MTNPVIVKKETYIPRNGGPVVFQVFEEVEVSPGRWIQLDPRNPTPEEVQSADDKAIAQQQSTIATLTAERDSLQSQLSVMTTERDTAVSEKASLQGQLDTANVTIETLQARIAELTAVAEQPVATLSQIRVWLLRTLGVNAIKQVDAMIAAIPDELERAIAFQQWEYANIVLRDNPFVLLIAQQLNLTSEQMDEAYLAATRIV